MVLFSLLWGKVGSEFLRFVLRYLEGGGNEVVVVVVCVMRLVLGVFN